MVECGFYFARAGQHGGAEHRQFAMVVMENPDLTRSSWVGFFVSGFWDRYWDRGLRLQPLSCELPVLVLQSQAEIILLINIVLASTPERFIEVIELVRSGFPSMALSGVSLSCSFRVNVGNPAKLSFFVEGISCFLQSTVGHSFEMQAHRLGRLSLVTLGSVKLLSTICGCLSAAPREL